MDSTGLLTLFRQEMDDLEDPPLWTDDEVFEYMTDAQKMLCRLTEGIADAQTPAICELALVEGTEWYPVNPLVLKLRKVYRGDTGREVPVINMENLERNGVRFDANASVLKALIAGFSDNTLRAWPVPSETVTLRLAVFRLPLYAITDADQVLEVNEKDHRHLTLWMRHLAYLKQDADTYDKKQADEYERRFNDYCYRALREQERARRQVGVTAYGGI